MNPCPIWARSGGWGLKHSRPFLATAMVLTCACAPAKHETPDRPASSSAQNAKSSIAPVPSASAANDESIPSAPLHPDGQSIACAAPCAPETTCALTSRGPACVACIPGSLPRCKDDQFVSVCTDDGAYQISRDCFAQGKRCQNGTCVSKECAPNALHCFEGNVYRCNATGTSRALETTCQTVDDMGTLTRDAGVCQVRRGVPACHSDCVAPDATILALFGCSECKPPADNFCATEGTHSCSDRICRHWPEGRSISGPWPVEGLCRRETEGLAVPGSDQRGICEGTGPIGTRIISYKVCRAGHAVSTTRTEPCQRH